MSAKIIKFPKKYKGIVPVSAPETSQELIHNILKIRNEHAAFIVDDVTQYMLNRFRDQGIAIASLGEIAAVDVSLVKEAIRSSVLRFYNIKYPFQKFANDHYAEMQKQNKNVKEIEELNPMMKTDPEPESPGPMVG